LDKDFFENTNKEYATINKKFDQSD